MRWRPLPAFAAIDFLSCLLVVFVAVALTSRPPQVKTYGAYAVVITWPPGLDDIDLYVRDPAGAISFFGKTQVDQMQLEHDDLGTGNTGYAHATDNQERTVVRSATPGQWIANVRLYFFGRPMSGSLSHDSDLKKVVRIQIDKTDVTEIGRASCRERV